MDFWGPYGIYAWELFYYIPAMVAYKYTQSQEFDLAKIWLQHIYDPTKTNNVWGCYPLAYLPDEASALMSINDVDNIPREMPQYYRLATVRQWAQNLIEQGDYYYRLVTTETLRQAKMCYVEVKNLWHGQSAPNIQDLTEVEDWNDPQLGAVQVEDFAPPYNEEVAQIYQTIEERLYNLRHWLSIDGTPLNIPLIAPPIDPRQLQKAALAGVSPAEFAQMTAVSISYSFEYLLRLARNYVENIISWSTNLLRYWGVYENLQYIELELSHELEMYDLIIALHQEAIALAEKNIEIKEKTRQEIEFEKDFNKTQQIWLNSANSLLQVYHVVRLGHKDSIKCR